MYPYCVMVSELTFKSKDVELIPGGMDNKYYLFGYV